MVGYYYTCGALYDCHLILGNLIMCLSVWKKKCVNQQEKDMSTSSFTPFGGGQRLCPGLDLARLEASIFLHHLVTSFRYVCIHGSLVAPALILTRACKHHTT